MNRCIALFLLIVGACSNVPANYQYDPQRSAGLAVGSITHDGNFGQYGFEVRAQASGKRTYINVGEPMAMPPFSRLTDDDLKAKGGTFAVELPAGEYRISGWRFVQGSRTLNATEPVDIPFSVEPGKAIYLGNIHFGKGWKVALRENSTRDLPVLTARYPVLAASAVVSGIATGTNIENIGGTYATTFAAPLYVPLGR